MLSHSGVSCQCANDQTATRRGLNPPEWKSIDVHQLIRSFDIELHEVYESRAASGEAHIRILLCCFRSGSGLDGLFHGSRLAVLECLHLLLRYLVNKMRPV